MNLKNSQRIFFSFFSWATPPFFSLKELKLRKLMQIKYFNSHPKLIISSTGDQERN